MANMGWTFDEVPKSIEPGTPGVYVIYLTNNPSKGYIGSSKCIRSRLMRHRSQLATGKHKNFKLRALYATFGPQDFRCKILETCEGITEARSREQVHIDFIGRDNLYNLDGQVYGR